MNYRVNKEFVLPVKSGSIFLNAGSVLDTTDVTLTPCAKGMVPLLKEYNFIEEANMRWKPEESELFWFIYADDMVGSKKYDPDDITDKKKVALGNCFQTKQQAEAEIAKMKAKIVLLDDSKGYIPNREEKDNCYQVRIMTGTRQLEVGIVGTDWIYNDGIYFYDYDAAAKSIAKHRKEWLILFNSYGEIKDEEVQ